jgi:hypothetical protein
VCARDPWVSPYRFTSTTPERYGLPAYHPTEQAMRAIADALDAGLRG